MHSRAGHANKDRFGLLCACLLMLFLAGCSLPAPDGLEASLKTQSAGLAPISQATGHAPSAIIRNALLLNPDVRAAANKVSAGADDVRVQRAALFPSLGLSLSGGAGDAGRDEASLDLRMRQLVLDFGDTKRAVTSADIDLQLAYVSFQEAVNDAIFDTLDVYDTVLRNVRLLEIRQSQAARLQELHDLVVRQTNIGAVSKSDQLETERKLRAAQFLVHDTSLALAEARDRLTEFTGQPKGGKLPLMTVGACGANRDTEPLQKQRLLLAKSELEVETARVARTPKVFVEPVLRRRESDGRLKAGIDIGVSSDLLQGGGLTAAVNAAEDQQKSAEAALDAVRRTARLEETRLTREIAAAEKKSAMLADQIALLEETRVLVRSQYLELGTKRVSDVLDVEEEYFDRKAETAQLASDLAIFRLECAIREGSIRGTLQLTDQTLYGFPL